MAVKVRATEPLFGTPIGEIELHTHSPEVCEGDLPCCVHNPSDHHMVTWPQVWRADRGYLMERVCPHGIGHPDPDHMTFVAKYAAAYAESFGLGVHGCDGCCHAPVPETS